MSDIVSFLRERYDEIEQVANAAVEAHSDPAFFPGVGDASQWKQDRGLPYIHAASTGKYLFLVEGIGEEEATAHVVLHDPASVLRDLESKRAIVDLCPDDAGFPDFDGGFQTGVERCLELLALPFASHPDYDESWRP